MNWEYGQGNPGGDLDHDGHPEIDCSNLVCKALQLAGYDVKSAGIALATSSGIGLVKGYMTTAFMAKNRDVFFDVVDRTKAEPGNTPISFGNAS